MEVNWAFVLTLVSEASLLKPVNGGLWIYMYMLFAVRGVAKSKNWYYVLLWFAFRKTQLANMSLVQRCCCACSQLVSSAGWRPRVMSSWTPHFLLVLLLANSVLPSHVDTPVRTPSGEFSVILILHICIFSMFECFGHVIHKYFFAICVHCVLRLICLRSTYVVLVRLGWVGLTVCALPILLSAANWNCSIACYSYFRPNFHLINILDLLGKLLHRERRTWP